MRFTRGTTGQNNDVDMTPLMDVIFILLIFFLVTASFIKETGIAIRIPQATSLNDQDEESAVIFIGQNGGIRFEGAELSASALYPRLTAHKAIKPNQSYALSVHPNTKTRFVVAALDDIRKTGDLLPPVSIEE